MVCWTRLQKSIVHNSACVDIYVSTRNRLHTMSNEQNFIGLLREFASHPSARGLYDDVAAIPFGGETLLVTHDMMIEGVHWLHDANPADIARKLVAVNLSDLAAKGAEPIGVILGYMLREESWNRAFAAGLKDALAEFNVPLLGGDTTASLDINDPCTIGITALGRATSQIVPGRNAAKIGDHIYVTGTLGNARAGYDLAASHEEGAPALLAAFNRPQPLLSEGRALAPAVHAMMDISDGLLLDASRIGEASGLAVHIDLASVPLSDDYIYIYGEHLQSRIDAVSWGDDYQLLFTAPPEAIIPVPATLIGLCKDGSGLSLHMNGEPVTLPQSLGFSHNI